MGDQIVLDHVTKVFTTKTLGNIVAVDDFNLRVHEGECFSFLGPSGCGKTETYRAIREYFASRVPALLVYQIDMTGYSYNTMYGVSNYSKGHQCPNADRVSNQQMNTQTYYCTNQESEWTNDEVSDNMTCREWRGEDG